MPTDSKAFNTEPKSTTLLAGAWCWAWFPPPRPNGIFGQGFQYSGVLATCCSSSVPGASLRVTFKETPLVIVSVRLTEGRLVPGVPLSKSPGRQGPNSWSLEVERLAHNSLSSQQTAGGE
jgi:hypothetical protein